MGVEGRAISLTSQGVQVVPEGERRVRRVSQLRLHSARAIVGRTHIGKVRLDIAHRMHCARSAGQRRELNVRSRHLRMS